MNLNTSAIRCALQVALLGAVTYNLRAVNVKYEIESRLITVLFYYDSLPSEEEGELAEIVVSELSSDFINVKITNEEIILPLPEIIPEEGLRIFHRYEKLEKEN